MRTNSGLNWSNISAGFAGASQGLSQAADIKAREQLEELRDQRAANLARMTFGWKAQHDVNMLERTEAGANIRAQASETGANIRSAAQIAGQKETTAREYQMQLKGQENYLTRMNQMNEYNRARDESKQSAENELRQQGLRAANRQEMQRMTLQYEQEIRKIDQAISVSAKEHEFELPDPKDPSYDAVAARHPELGKLLEQRAELGQQKTIALYNYTMAGAQLGDKDFMGANQPLPPAAPSGAAPSLIPSGGGTATPNNPLEPSAQLPRYPGMNPADNVPATAAPPPSGPTAGSAAGRSAPTFAPPRAPITSMVGPLMSPPQIIPGRALQSQAPMPGVNMPAGAGAFPGIGNPMGAPPSLIPQQGY